MNEDRTKLEQLMRDRAAEVPHRQDAPPQMLGRARRRVVRNAAASVVAAGLIVAGASAGLAGLGALHGPHHSLASRPTSPPASTLACTAGDLRAGATWQGAMGSVLGPIDLTNRGPNTCTLQGRPVVSLVSSTGEPLSPQVVAVPAQWQVDGKAAPHGWPLVTLRPGAVAAIRIRWGNQCPQLSGPARWTVDLGGGRGALEVSSTSISSPPPCNGAAEPSTLDVGPFEPGTE